MIAFFTAARGLTLADYNLIDKLQPVMIALLAPSVLGAQERSGGKLWVLLVLGLAGCAVLLAPELAMGSTLGLWALVGVALSSAAQLCLRALGPTDDARTVVFWFQAGVAILGVAALAATTGNPLPRLPLGLLPWLVLMGICGTAGQILMTRAYAEERAAVVAAMSYTSPLWAVALDVLLFHTWPDAHALVGGALVIAAGVPLLLQRSPAAARAK
jgi:drug/metabolite transporter (DMT)-like permease